MDVGDDPSPGDGGLDEGVQLLVPPDGQLQVPRGGPLDVQVLGGVTGQLHHLDIAVRDWDFGAKDRSGIRITSATRYSRMAPVYTAAVPPT